MSDNLASHNWIREWKGMELCLAYNIEFIWWQQSKKKKAGIATLGLIQNHSGGDSEKRKAWLPDIMLIHSGGNRVKKGGMAA